MEMTNAQLADSINKRLEKAEDTAFLGNVLKMAQIVLLALILWRLW